MKLLVLRLVSKTTTYELTGLKRVAEILKEAFGQAYTDTYSPITHRIEVDGLVANSETMVTERNQSINVTPRQKFSTVH